MHESRSCKISLHLAHHTTRSIILSHVGAAKYYVESKITPTRMVHQLFYIILRYLRMPRCHALPKCGLKGGTCATSTKDPIIPKLTPTNLCFDHMPLLENLSLDALCLV